MKTWEEKVAAAERTWTTAEVVNIIQRAEYRNATDTCDKESMYQALGIDFVSNRRHHIPVCPDYRALWARYTYPQVHEREYRLRRSVAYCVPANFHSHEGEPRSNGVTVEEMRNLFSHLCAEGYGAFRFQEYDGRNDEYDIVTALQVNVQDETVSSTSIAYKVEAEDEQSRVA